MALGSANAAVLDERDAGGRSPVAWPRWLTVGGRTAARAAVVLMLLAARRRGGRDA